MSLRVAVSSVSSVFFYIETARRKNGCVFSGHHFQISLGYLKGKIVALYHRFPVVLMQSSRLGLLHLRLKLCGEHVLHSVDGSADFNA